MKCPSRSKHLCARSAEGVELYEFQILICLVPGGIGLMINSWEDEEILARGGPTSTLALIVIVIGLRLTDGFGPIGGPPRTRSIALSSHSNRAYLSLDSSNRFPLALPSFAAGLLLLGVRPADAVLPSQIMSD